MAPTSPRKKIPLRPAPETTLQIYYKNRRKLALRHKSFKDMKASVRRAIGTPLRDVPDKDILLKAEFETSREPEMFDIVDEAWAEAAPGLTSITVSLRSEEDGARLAPKMDEDDLANPPPVVYIVYDSSESKDDDAMDECPPTPGASDVTLDNDDEEEEDEEDDNAPPPPPPPPTCLAFSAHKQVEDDYMRRSRAGRTRNRDPWVVPPACQHKSVLTYIKTGARSSLTDEQIAWIDMRLRTGKPLEGGRKLLSEGRTLYDALRWAHCDAKGNHKSEQAALKRLRRRWILMPSMEFLEMWRKRCAVCAKDGGEDSDDE